MAAIASRYARALVEVILEQKIDADVARQQLRSHCGSGPREHRTAPGVGIAGNFRGAEARRAGCHCQADGRSQADPEFLSRYLSITGALRCWMTWRGSLTVNWTHSWDSPRPKSPAPGRLSADEKRELESQLERLTGKKVRAHLLLQSRPAGRSDGARRQHDL